MAVINVGISDLSVGGPPDVIATYALGSCVGICLYDNSRKIGGLAHIMLPDSREAKNGSESPRRYADTAIDELLRLMRAKGANPINLTAKIAGGAQMFKTQLSTFNIGARNVDAVKRVLSAKNIKIIAEDTGKDYGRTVFFDTSTGIMTVKAALKGDINL